MTTLVELLINKDPGSEGLLTPSILEITDLWLSWWERDALDHVKWCQNKHISIDSAMGRLHQIQEIRQGLTDKQSIDTPSSKVRQLIEKGKLASKSGNETEARK